MWMALRERVTAIDELNMAMCRMRLREPDESIIDPPPSNIVEPSQVICCFILSISYQKPLHMQEIDFS